MRYKIGMKIVFLHEEGGGEVKEIMRNGRILVEDEDGFNRIYLPSQIAPVYHEEYPVDDDVISEIQLNDTMEFNKKKKKQTNAERAKNDVPEIDLHIEELTTSHADLSNHEILTKQMNAFRQFYAKERANKTRKIVIIHGVGEGVLRYEVRKFLDKENGVEFYDANYQEYGQGATVVELFG